MEKMLNLTLNLALFVSWKTKQSPSARSWRSANSFHPLSSLQTLLALYIMWNSSPSSSTTTTASSCAGRYLMKFSVTKSLGILCHEAYNPDQHPIRSKNHIGLTSSAIFLATILYHVDCRADGGGGH